MTPQIVTSDFDCRLIGDRMLAEEQFGRIQIDRGQEIRKWTKKFKEVSIYKKERLILKFKHN
jgi:hypothetical protein